MILVVLVLAIPHISPALISDTVKVRFGTGKEDAVVRINSEQESASIHDAGMYSSTFLLQ